MFEKMGGRKFVLSLIVILVGTAVQILSPHGVTESFTALLIGVAGVFGASNAFVSAKSVGVVSETTDVASEPALPAGPPGPSPEQEAQIQALEAQLAQQSQVIAQLQSIAKQLLVPKQ